MYSKGVCPFCVTYSHRENDRALLRSGIVLRAGGAVMDSSIGCKDLPN